MTTQQGKDFWLGVDLAQATFDAAIAPMGGHPQQWRKLAVKHFDNSAAGIEALGRWLKPALARGRCLGVVLEATGQLAVRFSTALAPLGLPTTSIVNPARSVGLAKSLGVRSKSDRIDGALLGVFGTLYQPAPTLPKPEAQQRLRELDRLRETLLEDLTRSRNRLRECLFEPSRRILEQQIAQLEQSVEQVEKELDKALEASPELQRQTQLLDTVSGIGPVVARTLTAELGDLGQYTRAVLVALVGVFPRTFESGSSVHKRARLAGGGGKRLRRVLYLAAMAIQRSQSPLKAFGQHLLEAGKCKMSMMGAVMRKLLLVGRAVVKSGKPYDPAEAGRRKPAQMTKAVLAQD